MEKFLKNLPGILLSAGLLLSGCEGMPSEDTGTDVKEADAEAVSEIQVHTGDVPVLSEDPYIVINENIPEFNKAEITTESFEKYAGLDELGRCTEAFACVGQDSVTEKKQKTASSIKPTGWHSTCYDSMEGKNLYVRCQLIGFKLTGNNADERNLITGTRYMKENGMQPFETMVADYVKETGNHVMMRVTPDFEGDCLTACGVRMEALSVEDDGEGICYHVYVYNIQPGIEIDYTDGSSREAADMAVSAENGMTYILDKNMMKFHVSSCDSIQQIQNENMENYTGERERLIDDGYKSCESCHP